MDELFYRFKYNLLRYYLFIQKFTIKKLFNLIKISYYYIFPNYTTKLKSFPYSVSIETSAYCNLNCPECPTGMQILTRNKGNMSIETFSLIIDQLSDYLVNVFLYFQGEPFFNPKLYQFINYTHKRKIYTVVSTNGHYLNKINCEKLVQSGLDEIIISLDGYNQETYEIYRVGGNFKTVIEGILNLKKAKNSFKTKYPLIRIQTLVSNYNIKYLGEIKKIAKNNGADAVYFKAMQIYNNDSKNDFLSSLKKYNRYLKKKNNYKKKCKRVYNSLVFTWDGNVLPCCYDKNASFIMGNIKQSKIEYIYNNNQFISFRKDVGKNKASIIMCRNCNL